MFCRVCHRLLTSPDSRKRGMGPICWARNSNLGPLLPTTRQLTLVEALQ